MTVVWTFICNVQWFVLACINRWFQMVLGVFGLELDDGRTRDIKHVVASISGIIRDQIVQLDVHIQQLLVPISTDNPPAMDIDRSRQIMSLLNTLVLELTEQKQSIQREMRHGFEILSGHPTHIHATLGGNGGIVIHHANKLQEINVRCEPVYVGCDLAIPPIDI